METEEGERKRGSATAPAACARELLWRPCVRVRHSGRQTIETFAALLSVDERFVDDCRSSARSNVYRDLDLTVWRPAVLAHAQPVEC
eukprot:3871546-Pleurochrysis_carterae.AAC.1